VVAVLGVALALVFVHDFAKGSVGRGTAVVGFVLPLTVVLIPGTLGALLMSMVHLWSTTLGTLITSLTSGGR
jgi:high-affinity K+ transport system ATPase subunit B